MDTTTFRTLYGQRCQAIVRCHACGRPHQVSGVLTPGRLAGDITLNGYTYPITDVVAAVPEMQEVVARSPFATLLPYAGLAWAALIVLERMAQR